MSNRMNRSVLAVVILALCLSACTPAPSPVLPSQTVVPSATVTPTIIPSATQTTLPRLTATPRRTYYPTITLAPTSTTTPYPLSINVTDLHTTGKLLISDLGGERYLVIDMATGEITQTSSPLNCLFPIFDNTQLICRGSGSLYLYDLATRSKHDLPNTHADRLYFWPWTLNSRFLVYGHWSNVNGHRVDINSYDLVTEQELLLAPDVPDDSEYYISSDGRHVVTLMDNRIIDIMSNPVADLTPGGYEDLTYNPYSLIWSPAGNLLYIGATDLASDAGPIVNYHFIANVDTGIVQRISISTDIRQTGLLGAYWSPDATRIALSDLPELCILYVDELLGECTEDIQEPGSSMGSIAWSPDSRYIAFSASGTIYLYATETREYSSLIENIHLSMFFWK